MSAQKPTGGGGKDTDERAAPTLSLGENLTPEVKERKERLDEEATKARRRAEQKRLEDERTAAADPGTAGVSEDIEDTNEVDVNEKNDEANPKSQVIFESARATPPRKEGAATSVPLPEDSLTSGPGTSVDNLTDNASNANRNSSALPSVSVQGGDPSKVIDFTTKDTKDNNLNLKPGGATIEAAAAAPKPKEETTGSKGDKSLSTEKDANKKDSGEDEGKSDKAWKVGWYKAFAKSAELLLSTPEKIIAPAIKGTVKTAGGAGGVALGVGAKVGAKIVKFAGLVTGSEKIKNAGEWLDEKSDKMLDKGKDNLASGLGTFITKPVSNMLVRPVKTIGGGASDAWDKTKSVARSAAEAMGMVDKPKNIANDQTTPPMPKTGSMTPKTESKTEPKIEPKTESKTDPPQPKVPKMGPNVDSKTDVESKTDIDPNLISRTKNVDKGASDGKADGPVGTGNGNKVIPQAVLAEAQAKEQAKEAKLANEATQAQQLDTGVADPKVGSGSAEPAKPDDSATKLKK